MALDWLLREGPGLASEHELYLGPVHVRLCIRL